MYNLIFWFLLLVLMFLLMLILSFRFSKAFLIPLILLIIFGPLLIININPFFITPQKDPKVALILGAGILNNETPSAILKKRLDLGLDLYLQNKIKAIIVSGDNSAPNYNEPQVMKKYLVQEGVPTNRIFEDFGGVRTADSCYRTKNFFKLNEVYLVTQEFHIKRAKFLCDSIGLASIPVPAESSRLYTEVWGNFREVFAAWTAVKDSISFEPKIKSDGREADFSKILQE